MVAVILGDVINSRKVSNHSIWLAPLKKLLKKYGSNPRTWEISRGDSFQLEVSKPELALEAALRIKSLIRSLDVKNLDVRMAIGVGEKSYQGRSVTESNGEAFINCGEKFETLKKIRQNLAIQTPWPEVDTELNLMLRFASLVMDKWSQPSAEIMHLQLMTARRLTQKELIRKLKLNQSSISERLTRARSEEILELEVFYRNLILKQLKA